MSCGKEFDLKVSNVINAGRNNASVESTKYFNDKLIKREDDPMNWWLLNGKYYPNMSMLAKKYLCITATSVPSEQLFSKAGELVSHKRSCLQPKNVNMLLFLNQNI